MATLLLCCGIVIDGLEFLLRLEVTDDEMATFHTSVDSHVVLSNERRTAQRIFEGEEFGEADGIIFSAKPLRDDQLFEVQIDRKAVGWVDFHCQLKMFFLLRPCSCKILFSEVLNEFAVTQHHCFNN